MVDENSEVNTVHKGLEDVLIDTSKISRVDGDSGDLWYAGYHIDELATRSTFPEILYLLWNRELPPGDDLETLKGDLAARHALPRDVEEAIASTAPDSEPMDVLRTAVSMLANYDDSDGVEDQLRNIVAKVPPIVAQIHRARQGLDLVSSDEELGHAANFLYMLGGSEPAEERARALDVALILYAEHGMNASTFASVVTTSTLANPYAAMTSAIGTLHGPLHGGATETVIDALQDIGSPEQADDWVDEQLDAGETIPGFGHRVYSVTDPRCKHFRREIEALDPEGEVADWYETAEALREAVEERLGDEGIRPNTDLYSGILYRSLGIPPALYTTMFTMSRVAGWSAHVIEQREDNRILRPRIKYEGDVGREYVPAEER